MVAGLGLEPRQNESESFVLPLHHPARFRRAKTMRKQRVYVNEQRGKISILVGESWGSWSEIRLTNPSSWPTVIEGRSTRSTKCRSTRSEDLSGILCVGDLV